ncbi:MAG: Winged helix DNA-binding domain, partial [Myxococcales bacterium]|nr:Winged helix DNA-binding domain [Myxococcales bacterium]
VADASRLRAVRSVENNVPCSYRHFTTLQMIETSDMNVTASELARLLGCTKANVTHLVRQLTSLGWLVIRPAFGDARAGLLRLTDSGHDVYEDGVEALGRIASWQLRVLDEAEKEQLDALLKKLAGGWE